MDGKTTMALRRLGEVLIAEGSITAEQLAAAIAEQERTGKRLGEILLAARSVSRLNLANAFAEQHADARRPTATQQAGPGPAPGSNESPGLAPGSDADLAGKLAQVDAVLARLESTTEELGGRLMALEALIPAISEALDCGSARDTP